MPIATECPNCANKYNAPDQLAGKRVRCKVCGTVFAIQQPVADPDAPPDLSAIDDETADDLQATVSGRDATRLGAPAHRDFGDPASSSGSAVRSAARFSYPGAKQVDQFLPPALLSLCPILIAAQQITSAPSTGNGISRAVFMLAALLGIVWPVTHLGLGAAIKKIGISTPKNFAIRSLACFMPAALAIAGLFVLGNGGLIGLVIGVFVGLLLCLGCYCLLLRIFPNELPVVSGFAGGAMAAGTAVASAGLVGLNFVAGSVGSNMADQSPFALALNWPAPAKPTPDVAASPAKPAVGSKTVPGNDISGLNNPPAGGPTTSTADPEAVDLEAGLASLPQVPLTSEQKLYGYIQSIHRPPIALNTSVESLDRLRGERIAFQREDDGTRLETWDTATWTRIGRTKPFSSVSWANIAVFPDGQRALRQVVNPRSGFEVLHINAPEDDRLIPVEMGVSTPTLIGFTDDKNLIYRMDSVNGPSQFMSVNVDTNQAKPIKLSTSRISVPLNGGLTQLSGGGRILLSVAHNLDKSVFQVLAMSLDADSPEVRTMPGDVGRQRPLGLGVDPDGRLAAVLSEADNEVQLTVWQMMPVRRQGIQTMPKRGGPVVERNLGLRTQFEPERRFNDRSSAIVILNSKVALIFGTTLVSLDNGAVIGKLGTTDVSRCHLLRKDTLLMEIIPAGVTDMARQWVVVRLDPAKLQSDAPTP
jgi:hypothetical protein